MPEAKISTDLKELIKAVLSEAEADLVEAGVDIRIMLSVENGEAKVSESDKNAVISALGDYKNGKYLDISLIKRIGGDDRTEKVYETKEAITISINIPEELKKAGRSFAVIRIHNGQASLLEDLDNSDDTVTIKTDRFSTYAICYKDAEISTTAYDKQTEGGGKTGDASLVMLFALMLAGGAVTLIAGRRQRRENM